MNKEELLAKLVEIKSHLPKNTLEEEKRYNEIAIAKMVSKLSNIDNYISYQAKFSNEARRFDYRTCLNKYNMLLTQSSNNLENLERIISTINMRIDNYQQIVLSLDKKILKEEEQILNSNNQTLITNLKTRSQYYQTKKHEAENMINELKGDLDDYSSDKQKEQKNIIDYQNRIEKYQNLVTSFENNNGNDEQYINVVLKSIDEDKLVKLNRLKDTLDKTTYYFDDNLEAELDIIISGLNNDSITVIEAIKRLREYQNQDNKDINIDLSLQRNTYLEQIDMNIADISKEIGVIEERLTDENNYKEVTFDTEVIGNEIERLQIFYDRALNDANNASNDSVKYAMELSYNEDESDQMNVQWKKYIKESMAREVAEVAVLDTVIDKIRIDFLKKDIEHAIDELTVDYASNFSIDHKVIEVQKRDAEIRKNQFIDKASKYLSKLNERKLMKDSSKIDMSSIENDKNNINILNLIRDSLEEYKKYINYNLDEVLQNIINS